MSHLTECTDENKQRNKHLEELISNTAEKLSTISILDTIDLLKSYGFTVINTKGSIDERDIRARIIEFEDGCAFAEYLKRTAKENIVLMGKIKTLGAYDEGTIGLAYLDTPGIRAYFFPED